MIASDLVVLVRAKTDKLGGDLNKSKGMFDGFAKALDSKLSSIVAPAAIIGGVTAIGLGLKSLASEMNDMGDAADKLGISLHSFMVFDEVAKRSATSIETIGGAITKMKRGLAEGTIGNILGVDNASLRGLVPEEAFSKIGKIIAGIKDPMERTRVEMEVFGKSGAELDSVILKLADDYELWSNSVASEESARALADAGERIDDFEQKVKKLSITLAGESLHAGSDLAEIFKQNLLENGPTGFTNIGDFAANIRNLDYDAIGKRIAAAEIAAQKLRDMKRQMGLFAESTQNATKAIADLENRFNDLVDPRENAIQKFQDSISGLDPALIKDYVDQFTELFDSIEGFKDSQKAIDASNKAMDDLVGGFDKQVEGVKRFGDQLKESGLSPLEEFQEKLKEIEKWRLDAGQFAGMGGIPELAQLDAIAAQGVEAAKQRAINAMKSPSMSPPSGDMVFNSREAANQIARAFAAQQGKAGNKDIEKVEKVAREQLTVLKNIEKNQKKEPLAAANL